jgi:hypothetical protein
MSTGTQVPPQAQPAEAVSVSVRSGGVYKPSLRLNIDELKRILLNITPVKTHLKDQSLPYGFLKTSYLLA